MLTKPGAGFWARFSWLWTDCCDETLYQCNESSVSIKDRTLFDQVTDYQLLRRARFHTVNQYVPTQR
jgi:hypothetical protein